MGTPKAEIAIDKQLVQRLLEVQHPDFAKLPLQHFDTGWDNVLFQLGATYLVRLPRRKVAAQLLRNEQIWLPQLASHLPIDIPVPIRTGQPTDDYPWHWSILPWFKGKTANIAPPAPDEAIRMAQFLKALHRPAPSTAPVNPFRGTPLSTNAAKVATRLHRLASKTNLITPTIQQLWHDALAARPATQSGWLHGDLHPRNVIVHHQTIRAIIDWGDITAGDAATDLACFWMLFESQQTRQQALQVYAPDADLLARAKGWALYFATVLLDTGLVDNPTHAEIGRCILERLGERKKSHKFL